MAIAYKLFSRMTDMAEDLALHFDRAKDRALVAFQDQVGWPFRASQAQLSEWNAKRWPGCDLPSSPDPNEAPKLGEYFRTDGH